MMRLSWSRLREVLRMASPLICCSCGNIMADRRRMPVNKHPETLRRVQPPRDERSIIAGTRASISRAGRLPRRVTHIGPLSPDSVHPLSPDEASPAPRTRPAAELLPRPGLPRSSAGARAGIAPVVGERVRPGPLEGLERGHVDQDDEPAPQLAQLTLAVADGEADLLHRRARLVKGPHSVCDDRGDLRLHRGRR